jgi:hypothetical protein
MRPEELASEELKLAKRDTRKILLNFVWNFLERILDLVNATQFHCHHCTLVTVLSSLYSHHCTLTMGAVEQ